MSRITQEQRFTISVMIRANYSQKSIAAAIGRDKSVISRELRRNKTDNGHYNFTNAQSIVEIRKERYSQARRFVPQMQVVVNRYLQQD